MRKVLLVAIFIIISLGIGFKIVMYNERRDKDMNFYMIEENSKHEGTWLTWPHKYTYGEEYQNEIENIWVQMTKSIHIGENVHIIAYNEKEKIRIEKILINEKIDISKVDFVIAKSNDVWVRDSGPIFVYDKDGNLNIANFDFDGWGKKADYKKDNKIPLKVGKQKNIPIVDINGFTLEGGSVELDGNGTFMGTLSSIVSENRNYELTVKEAEEYITRYLGATNFIWLEGVINEDITDAHIDGMARFLDEKTILTVSKEDFSELYEGINIDDYDKLLNAKNSNNENYEIVEIPLTKNNPHGVDYKGSYLNYYIGNDVVLLPVYNDENDSIAIEIISELYPDRKVVPINVNSLYKYGGMIHCVTQQQPSM